MLSLAFTNKFEKDLKRIKKRSKPDFELIRDFLNQNLATNGVKGLLKKHLAHKLTGNYKDN